MSENMLQFRVSAIAALTTLSFCATLAQAGTPELSPPVECTLGETCFIQHGVDHIPDTEAARSMPESERIADANCGKLTYDGHKGTDFALLNLGQMQAGVPVLASAAGKVVRLRDGVPDVSITSPQAPKLNGQDCGNGVVIDHGDGWETQYCHLKQGSVSVKPGQMVQQGTPLGEIGLSGNTSFPHVHLSVRHNGEVIDPFAPDMSVQCGGQDDDLWQEDIALPAGGIISMGMTTKVAEYEEIKAGTELPHPERNLPLVGWFYGFGLQAGDNGILRLEGPEGVVFDKTLQFDRPQAQAFRAFGRRAPQGGWSPGAYHLTVSIVRRGVEVDMEELGFALQ